METLGERIRRLRKEKKLTLVEVADGKLSKGMLSLIENGKAQPSMESLQHIAKQLSVDASELLGNQQKQEIRALLNKVEDLWKTAFEVEEAKQIKDLIQPFLTTLTDTYEGARLLDVFGRCSYIVGDEDYLTYLKGAETIYKRIFLFNELVHIYIFHANMQFNNHDYVQSLSIILKVRKDIEEHDWHINKMTQLDLDYFEGMLYYAVGEYKKGSIKVEEALSFTSKARIFHKVAELYRLAIMDSIMNKDHEKRLHYLKKLKQYADFADDEYSQLFVDILNIHYCSSYSHDYEKAFEMISNININNHEDQAFKHFIYVEKGSILFGLGLYKEALLELLLWKKNTYVHHPLDISLEYRVYAYRALCYLELGDMKQAQKEIEIGITLFESLPPTPYKDFTLETYEKINKLIK